MIINSKNTLILNYYALFKYHFNVLAIVAVLHPITLIYDVAAFGKNNEYT